MRRSVATLALVSIISGALATAGAAAGSPASSLRSQKVTSGRNVTAPYVPGEVLVRYEQSVPRAERATVRRSAHASVKSDISGLRTQLLDLPPNASVTATVKRLNAMPGVALAEPNYLIEPTAEPVPDPDFRQLWGFDNTGQQHGLSDSVSQTLAGKADADGDVPEAWQTTTGAPETVIAVLDSGVDVTHPDLVDSLWRNPGESGDGKETNGQDDDGNGKVDDVHGWDFAQDDAILLDPPTAAGYDHGTHVAGTIAAQANNGIGVAGVCPNCKIMVLKFMSPNGGEMWGSVAAELKAYEYAKQNGADIVNGSFGSFGFSSSQRSAIASLKNAGILAVFSAANSSGDNDLSIAVDNNGTYEAISPGYPASYNLPGILSVAASDHKDRYGMMTLCETNPDPEYTENYCSFTNFGEQSVDVAAPGSDILSTLPGNRYAYFDGTSMAAPFAAGVAGLVKSQHPQYTPVQIKNAIMRSVDRPTSYNEVFSYWLLQGNNGWSGKWLRSRGRINADRALDAATTGFPVSDGNIDGAVKVDGVMSGAAVWGGDANDIYKKYLVKGRKYKVILDGQNATTYGFSLNLVVYKPGTKEIYQWGRAYACNSCSSPDNDEVQTLTPRKSGNHYFQVTSFMGDKFRYSLRVKKV